MCKIASQLLHDIEAIQGGITMEEKEVILTQEGYNNLEKELNFLKTEKRADIADRIKVALGFGDLSENSE